MAIEIERKFLVADDSWKQAISSRSHFRQGYLTDLSGKSSVRIRLTDDGGELNIKSMTLGVRRLEYEYEIPVSDATQMLDQLCQGPLIEKVRYLVDYQGHTWEIDVFSGDNQGLVVAEIELSSEDEAFSRPAWLGEEVTDDPRYYNVALIQHPFKDW